MKKKIACLTLALITGLSAVPAYAQSISVVVEETPVVFTPDASPVIINSRTMIPLRGVFEQLGYEVFWQTETKTAVLAMRNKPTIRISAGSTEFYKGEDTMYAEVPAQIINGRMYLPLRAVGEAAGMEVAWDAETKTVRLDESTTVTPSKTAKVDLTKAEVEELAHRYSENTMLKSLTDMMANVTERDNVNEVMLSKAKADTTKLIDKFTFTAAKANRDEFVNIINSQVSNDVLENDLEAFKDKLEMTMEKDTAKLQELMLLVSDEFSDEVSAAMENAMKNRYSDDMQSITLVDMMAKSFESMAIAIDSVEAKNDADELVKTALSIVVNGQIDLFKAITEINMLTMEELEQFDLF